MTKPEFDLRPLTIEELAERLGISVRTIHRLRKRGLPAHLVGKALIFRPREVEAWLEETNWQRREYRRRGLDVKDAV